MVRSTLAVSKCYDYLPVGEELGNGTNGRGHIDGSKHRWFQDDRYYDLVVILDDATSRIYYAQLVAEESTRTVMAATNRKG
jgi:hypothetical protein